MNAATLLVGLYPPAVRHRWGTDLRAEVADTGIRCWPDTLAGAARLWLHPADWPSAAGDANRRVITVMLFAIISATALLLRTVRPSGTLTADLQHPASSLWLVPLLLGALLATPLPLRSRDALRRLAFAVVRTMAGPAIMTIGMLAMAWSGMAQDLDGPADIAVTAYYWTTLGVLALRGCVMVGRAASVVILPSTRRQATALLLIGAGLALAACQSMLSLITAGPKPMMFVQPLTLGLLAATALSAGHDLYAARRRPSGT
jgi:hypothetical protein